MQYQPPAGRHSAASGVPVARPRLAGELVPSAETEASSALRGPGDHRLVAAPAESRGSNCRNLHRTSASRVARPFRKPRVSAQTHSASNRSPWVTATSCRAASTERTRTSSRCALGGRTSLATLRCTSSSRSASTSELRIRACISRADEGTAHVGPRLTATVTATAPHNYSMSRTVTTHRGEVGPGTSGCP